MERVPHMRPLAYEWSGCEKTNWKFKARKRIRILDAQATFRIKDILARLKIFINHVTFGSKTKPGLNSVVTNYQS